MKRLLIVLCLVAGVVAPVFAQSDVPRDYASMSQRDREREMQASQWQGPSGFWTSPHKSGHGAYRYRLLLLGLGLIGITGLLTWRLIQHTKAPANRTSARRRGPDSHAGGPTFPTAVASFRSDGSSDS
jgi:hypothetical protein